MKTKLLIIIGISIVTVIPLSYYTIYDSSTDVFLSCDPIYEQINNKCTLKISETDYKELECLRLYKDIREISRTDGMALAERHTIDMHKSLVFEYVEKDCPNFPDLEFIYNNYKQNILESEPDIGELAPIPEPDTGEFRYGLQECHYTDAKEEQNFCVVEGWTKPASELDCEEICKSPGTKE